MGEDSDEENNKQNEEKLKFESRVPAYKLRSNDMPLQALQWAAICNFFILVADEGFKKYELDKDIAIHVVKSVRQQPLFDEGNNNIKGDGEWQCIVGRNFAASLTFESKKLVFFDLNSNGKSILLFKAG